MAPSVDPTVSSDRSHQVLLGLGSNLGQREENLLSALEELSRAGVSLNSVSSCYESSPQGGPPQSDYLNLVCLGRWEGTPERLLEVCRSVEDLLGRVRDVRWGPRTIDIDILLMGRLVIVRDSLQVPHPRMESRSFVLVPAVEVAPDLIHPVQKKTLRELLARLGSTGSVRRRLWPKELLPKSLSE